MFKDRVVRGPYCHSPRTVLPLKVQEVCSFEVQQTRQRCRRREAAFYSHQDVNTRL